MIFRSPILLHYYITNRCNCSCSFCNIWQQKPLPFADLGDVKKNLYDAKKLGAKFVDFTGGEPLLHPHLPEMLEAAKGLGFQTSVTTNCVLYPKKAKQLQGKVDYLHFSLDALDESLHDSLRGENTFFHVMQSLDIAKALRERPDILFTVTNRNVFQINKMAKFAQELRLFLIVNPQFFYFNNARLENIVWDHINSVASFPFVYVNKALNHLHKSGGNDNQNPRCRVVDSCIVISPQNELLLPCYHFAQNKTPIVGTLEAARKKSDFIKARKNQGRYEFCNSCALNCYFDPSFLYNIDSYFIKSIVAKAKYFINKKISQLNSPMFDTGFSSFEIAQQILDLETSNQAANNKAALFVENSN
jgi:MoaA/NifB/PqqE/SkfB family radical SAM enzyme